MDKSKYLSQLAEIFRGINVSGVVLNDRFSHFENSIWERIHVNPIEHHYSQEDSSLLKECNTHANKYSSYIRDSQVICLVHPFHLALRHLHLLNNKGKEDFKIYLANLNKLFANRGKKKIVVLETAHNYAAITSLFLENKTVDEVIFTEPDGARLHDSLDVYRFHHNDFFLAGGYYKKKEENPGCLLEAKRFLEDDLKKKVYAIQGLILNTPGSVSETGYLLPPTKELSEFQPVFSIQKRVFGLDDVLKANDLKSLVPKSPLSFFGFSC